MKAVMGIDQIPGQTIVAAVALFAGSYSCFAGSTQSAPAVVQARSEITINDTGVAPENLTSSKDGTVFFGSTTKGTIYRTLPNGAQAEPWIKGDAAGMKNSCGLLADDQSNTLWVCSNRPFGGNAGSNSEIALRAFDLKTGAPKGTYPIEGGGIGNDIAVATDGTVYVTETMGGRVFRLKPKAAALEEWIKDPQQRGLDGIAILEDGALYINNYFNGKLLKVGVKADGSPEAVVEIPTSMPFRQPDGLRASGAKTMLQVEGSGRLTEITIDGDKAEVRVIKEGLTRAVGVTQVGETAFVLIERLKAVAVRIDRP